MIKLTKLSVNIHDKTQLETVLNYDFSSGKQSRVFERKQKYNLDVYFFFPPQLNINKSSYSKEDFYEDIRPLIRLKEPNYSYDDFIPEKEKLRQSPFDFLKEKLKVLSKNKSSVEYQTLINELKILTCSLTSYISKTRRDLVKELKSLSKKERNEEQDRLFFEKARVTLKKFFFVFKSWQELYSQIHERNDEDSSDLKKEICLLDENILSVFYRSISSVFFFYEKYFPSLKTKESESLRRRLKAWLSILRYHYKTKSYFILSSENSRYEKESYSMRLSYLKKRMWQVLYLDVKDKASLFKKRQLAYIAAAGFAAIWALMANLFIWHKLNFHGFNAFFDYSDGVFGLSTYLIVLAFISAYILKDRIKDFARDKFQGGLFKHLPDSAEQICYYDKKKKKRTSLGMIYESQQYLENLSFVPLEIRQYRSNRLKGRFIDQEEVIHYHKKIVLDTKKIRRLGKDLTAIRDIIRLSVKRYVTRLDDPEEENFLMSKEGSMKMTMLPKVYYIDLVLKYSKKTPSSNAEEVIFECRRLILNKEGLVRIMAS